MRFKNRVAIVSGAASGIGLVTAKQFGQEGARVIVADLNLSNAQAAVSEIKKNGAPEAFAVQCDVSHEEQVTACFDLAMQQFHQIDIVVNNAGLMTFKPLEELQSEDWIRVLSVDLLGAFFFTKYSFQHMKPGSAIVNVSSVHAIETTPGVAPYAAAKAALDSLTRSAALEGKPKGIRVNAVLPGAIDTPMLWDNPNVKAGLEKIQRSDVGRPEDIASVICFLASDEACFVQGASILADGGRLSRL